MSSSLPTATFPSPHSSSQIQLSSLTQQIAEVQQEIKAVKGDIKQATEEIKKYKPEGKLWTYWSDKENRLRDQLTELSKKENLLLQQQQQGNLQSMAVHFCLLAAGLIASSIRYVARFY